MEDRFDLFDRLERLDPLRFRNEWYYYLLDTPNLFSIKFHRRQMTLVAYYICAFGLPGIADGQEIVVAQLYPDSNGSFTRGVIKDGRMRKCSVFSRYHHSEFKFENVPKISPSTTWEQANRYASSIDDRNLSRTIPSKCKYDFREMAKFIQSSKQLLLLVEEWDCFLRTPVSCFHTHGFFGMTNVFIMEKFGFVIELPVNYSRQNYWDIIKRVRSVRREENDMLPGLFTWRL